MATCHFILFTLLALNFFSDTAYAYDITPLQDFCVANLTSSSGTNGLPLPCMDPAKVEADHFFFSGLHLPGNTSNPIGAAFSAVTVNQIPGLNSQGLVIARLDFKRKGFFPPHFHARATEILTVLKGCMEVGFIISNPSFRHYSKVVCRGDVFVVPVGLVHYQRNVGKGNIVAMAALNSQSPGISTIPNAIFGANPDINSDYLSQAFALDKKIVEDLQAKF